MEVQEGGYPGGEGEGEGEEEAGSEGAGRRGSWRERLASWRDALDAKSEEEEMNAPLTR